MIVYVVQKRNDDSCKQEQQLPSNVHQHHLPSREGKKNLRSRSREATATVWLSPGAFGTAYIISFYFIAVNILLNLCDFFDSKESKRSIPRGKPRICFFFIQKALRTAKQSLSAIRYRPFRNSQRLCRTHFPNPCYNSCRSV